MASWSMPAVNGKTLVFYGVEWILQVQQKEWWMNEEWTFCYFGIFSELKSIGNFYDNLTTFPWNTICTLLREVNGD